MEDHESADKFDRCSTGGAGAYRNDAIYSELQHIACKVLGDPTGKVSHCRALVKPANAVPSRPAGDVVSPSLTDQG